MEVELNDLSVFVDASISTKIIGIGAIIFTTNKRAQAALSKPQEGNLSVFFLAEALALLVGLRWAQSIGLPIKIITSDSLSLVQALNKISAYHNELEVLLSDIEMLTKFPEANVQHVNRKFNSAAHRLAKQALLLEDESSWMEEIPQNPKNHL